MGTITATELRFTTACGHKAIVKPVKKVGGKWEGKWICRITGPTITNQKGVKTAFSNPGQIESQERIAIVLGLATSEVRLSRHPVTGHGDRDLAAIQQTEGETQAGLSTSSTHNGAGDSKNDTTARVERVKATHKMLPSLATIADENKPPAKKPRMTPKPDGIVVVRSTLREALRVTRRNCAKKKKVPPYFVFDNATLDEIVTKLPLTDAELLTVRGIGPTEAKEYGSLIFGIIRNTILPLIAPTSDACPAVHDNDDNEKDRISPFFPVQKQA